MAGVVSDPAPLAALRDAPDEELRRLIRALLATLVGMDAVQPTGAHLGDIIKIARAVQETGTDDAEGMELAAAAVAGRLSELRGDR